MPKKKTTPNREDEILAPSIPLAEAEEETEGGEINPDLVADGVASEEDHEFDEEEIFGDEKDSW